MVFGRADHDKKLGVVQIRPAKFPEAAADGVDHAGGHVHRAKTTMRGVIGRAKLARKQAGERLHLVAPGEEGKLLGVGAADLLQTFGEDLKR